MNTSFTQKFSFLLFVMALHFSLGAQSELGTRIKNNAKNKVNNRIEQRADQAVDATLDKAEDAVVNGKKKKKKKKKKGNNAEQGPTSNNQQGAPSSPSSSNGNISITPEGTRVDASGNTDYSNFKNFDFVPGERVLFFDDFSNLFNLWNRVSWDEWEESDKGIITTSSVAPGNWFFMPRKGMTAPKSLGALPNQFTLEFDFFFDENQTEHEGGITVMFVKEKSFNINNYDFYFERNTRLMLDVHPAGNLLYLKGFREYGYTGGIDGSERILIDQKENYIKPNQKYRMSISRNGSHVKLFINQDKVIDLPNAFPANEVYTFMFGNNSWRPGLYVSNIRLATGAPQPAIEINNNKPYVTQNIHFDVNSDVIKPISYAVLKEVANMMKASPGQFKIIGHTDSDGSEQHNMVLSQKRAESVKRALVKEFGIDPNRIICEGKGQTQPLNNNANASEKAQNRRVEFIKF